jgi:Tol biopolymer transport system component
VLAVIPATGGKPNLISASSDKQLYEPRWSRDGKNIIALMEDDRQQLVASFNVGSEQFTKLASGEKVFLNAELNRATGDWLVNMTDPQTPAGTRSRVEMLAALSMPETKSEVR